jgi:hypothetical protein
MPYFLFFFIFAKVTFLFQKFTIYFCRFSEYFRFVTVCCPRMSLNEQGLGAVAASQRFGRERNFQTRTTVSAGTCRHCAKPKLCAVLFVYKI